MNKNNATKAKYNAKKDLHKGQYLDNNKFALIIAIFVIVAAIAFIELGKRGNFGSSPKLDNLRNNDDVSPTDDYISNQLNQAQSKEFVEQFQARIHDKEKKYPKAIELIPTGYLNTPNDEPITISSLIGKKVILIDFWTYSCINCQRTLPYLNAWYDKYKNKGLVIIGVHSPEFDFEKDRKNVEFALNKYNISFPVVQDNDHSTFEAYQNRYWPRKYLIDIDGFIRYNHIGEGNYEETEDMIKELLKERESIFGMNEHIPSDLIKPVTQMSDPLQIGSPETYFGSARNTNLGNGIEGVSGIQRFESVKDMELNKLYLSGEWNISDEYAECKKECKISYAYLAKDVYLVAGSQNQAMLAVKVDNLQDPAFFGVDNNEGNVKILDYGLYHLIAGKTYSHHNLEIVSIQEGTKFYTFTFG